jgi:hypothetical protein
MTNTGSIFNVGFGLIDNEQVDGFLWLCSCLQALCEEKQIPAPKVVLTDYDKALKSALCEIFPDAAQQLCIFHINSNMLRHVKTKWNGPPDVTGEEEDGISQRTTNMLLSRVPNPGIPVVDSYKGVPHTREGFLTVWRSILYAPTKDDFKDAWTYLIDIFGAQEDLLTYIQVTLMPVRRQWAQCWICKNLNFGLRVTSPTESAHSDLKSYLVTGKADLFTVGKSVAQMVADILENYFQKLARDEITIRQEYIHREWLGDIPKKLTNKAIELIIRQYRFAIQAVPVEGCPSPPVLRPCRQQFTTQFGLPCSHIILTYLTDKKPLEADLAHPFWRLRTPLVCFLLYSPGQLKRIR